jgi:hypothetical protein
MSRKTDAMRNIVNFGGSSKSYMGQKRKAGIQQCNYGEKLWVDINDNCEEIMRKIRRLGIEQLVQFLKEYDTSAVALLKTSLPCITAGSHPNRLQPVRMMVASSVYRFAECDNDR